MYRVADAQHLKFKNLSLANLRIEKKIISQKG